MGHTSVFGFAVVCEEGFGVPSEFIEGMDGLSFGA
jgi:hypothetical protein